jgi:secondary thiamine-phosphate synthase enzyme
MSKDLGFVRGEQVWFQKEVQLKASKRGCSYVGEQVEAAVGAQLRCVRVGQVNFFLRHTSASLLLSECWDRDVLLDMESALCRLAPEGTEQSYRHSCEGPDDMPAHIKNALLGCSVTVPVREGRLAMGTWQGLWLAEHRDHASPRNLLVTVQGVLY